MSVFRLRVRLDPGPDHAATLAAYPADALRPDFAVVTSGALAIDLGAHAVAYRAGRVMLLPAGSTDPAVWLPDYLGGFLHRLAGAVLDLRPNQPTTAHLVDAPAALAFSQTSRGAPVTIAYLHLGQAIQSVTLPITVVRAAIADALTQFLTQLQSLNPRLVEHPDVIALTDQHRALRDEG